MRSRYLNEEIKWLGCHECKNKKGCQKKYGAVFIHPAVPEECIIENKFKKEELKAKNEEK